MNSAQPTKSTPLDETNFALLLAEGAVQLRCEQCGQETSWKLALPRRREPQPRRESAPRRLLVIDDDRHTLQVLQMMLRSDDYVVETAISADQAVQKLQAADFDAIVSDIRMPGFGRAQPVPLPGRLPARLHGQGPVPDGRPERENAPLPAGIRLPLPCSNRLT